MGRGDVVCVTGAGGFIGSALVKELLSRGYTVHGSVRRLNDTTHRYEYLRSLEGARSRLHLFTADLLREGSFDAAIAQCDGVFHTASPFFFRKTGDPERELLQPAVQGTLNVLRSCQRSKRVRRVVVTSSMAAVMLSKAGISDPQHVFTERDWSDEQMQRDMSQFYTLSKTMAERAAWSFVEESGAHFSLATVNPTMVIGPMLQPALNTSNELIAKLLSGARRHVPAIPMSFVDVRDVARAHAVVYEGPQRGGRHICVGDSVRWLDVAQKLKALYPAYNIPLQVKGGAAMPASRIDTSKLRSYGFDYMPLEASLQDTVDSLVAHGHISAAPAAKL